MFWCTLCLPGEGNQVNTTICCKSCKVVTSKLSSYVERSIQYLGIKDDASVLCRACFTILNLLDDSIYSGTLQYKAGICSKERLSHIFALTLDSHHSKKLCAHNPI